jgi:hypothetical protein
MIGFHFRKDPFHIKLNILLLQVAAAELLMLMWAAVAEQVDICLEQVL